MLSRRAAVALAPLGTIAGHAAGYALAGQDAGFEGDHSHLGPAAWVASAVATATLVAVAARPRPCRAALSLKRLVVGQLALFLGLEAVEHLISGHSPVRLLAEPSLRWGLVGQVLAAGVLLLVVRLAQASGTRLRALLTLPPRQVDPSPPTIQVPRDSAALQMSLASPASERGPPRTLVIA